MDKQEAIERLTEKRNHSARMVSAFEKMGAESAAGYGELHVMEILNVRMFDLAIAALSDRGYEQGYKDGRKDGQNTNVK